MPSLSELFVTLPFLRELPSALLERLDTASLHSPEGDAARLRASLEKELGCHIATYRAGYPQSDGRLHLCRLLAPASLTPARLKILQQAEAAFHKNGIVIVAYEKPLRIVGP